MKRIRSFALAAGIALALVTASYGEVTLNSVRIMAQDPEALGRFYDEVFGLKETNRLQIDAGVELFLNFGETTEAARANSSPQIVIMQSPEGPGEDTTPHVIFTVDDAAEIARAAAAAGGSIEREPTPYGNSGLMIGFVVDPEGNRIELIQPPSR